MTLPADVATMLDAAADKHGIPREVARAVAWVESRGNQGSKSAAGAIGVMQLMPDTAKGLGVDPFDVRQNIDGGVRFLAGLWKRFGVVRKALAAYNWGPGRVASGRPWPQQVKTYVDRVLARAADELPGGDAHDGTASASAPSAPDLAPSSPPVAPARGSETSPFVSAGSPSSSSAQPSLAPSPSAPGADAERLANAEAMIVQLAGELDVLTGRVVILERAFDEPITAPVELPAASVTNPVVVLPAVLPAVTGGLSAPEAPAVSLPGPTHLEG